MAAGSSRDRPDPIPAFVPHPWVRGGDAQTIAGRWLPGRRVRLRARYVELEVSDGDRIVVLDSTPPGWRPGDPAALFVHGLAGCVRSPYVARPAARLLDLGYRAVRMNLRGAGSGFGAARSIYHAGRTEDVRVAAEWLAARAPGSPIALVGFSLGANLVLKLAAEAASRPLAGLDCVLAANPPLDLSACCRHLARPEARIYDRNFVRLLGRMIDRLHAAHPDLGPANLGGVGSLYDFDDRYTARRNGFEGAEAYYADSSAGPLVPQIQVPGLVVHAEDDPFIPLGSIRAVAFPPHLPLELCRAGGHLGYLSHRPWRGDRRWLDARIAAWLETRWGDRAGGNPATGPDGGRSRDVRNPDE